MSRAVLFDVDGVLIHGFHTREDRRRRWDEHLQADLGVDPVAFQERFIRQSFIADVINGRASLINKLETVRIAGLQRLGDVLCQLLAGP